MIRTIQSGLMVVFFAISLAGICGAAEPVPTAKTADSTKSTLAHAASVTAVTPTNEPQEAAEPASRGFALKNPVDMVAIMGIMLPIIVSLGFFTAVIIIIALPLAMRSRRDRQLHQTIRAMVEKGLAIPPELIITPKRKSSDVQRGIVLVASGAGLITFFLLFADLASKQGLWSVGLIPLFIGVGYLVVARLEGNKSNGKDAA